MFGKNCFRVVTQMTTFLIFAAFVITLSSCSGSSNSDSTSESDNSGLAAVTGLTATPGNGQLLLAWDTLAGAASYNIYWEETPTVRSVSRVSDCSGQRVEGETGNIHVIDGLTNGTPYNVGVTGVDSDGKEGECGEGATSGTPSAGGGGSQVFGCNHPEATNYDPLVTDYVPGSCTWPAAPTPTTPPITTVALAEVSKTDTTWTGSATINKNGTGYCAAIVGGMPAPVPSEVKADNNVNKAGFGSIVAMAANTAANCVVAGLTANTTYDFYFVAEDGIPNLQTTISGPVTSTLPLPPGMVAVPSGCFMMGDNFAPEGQADELPVHQVCFAQQLFMDATEVTQGAYTAWVTGGVNPSGFTRAKRGAWLPANTSNYPVETVSHTESSAYCAAQGKRLPTEAEWEYAARNGGQVVKYGTGADTISCATANGYLAAGETSACVNAANGGSTAPVGSYPPNALGLFDMTGNVYELVSDRYLATYYTGRPTPDNDPLGPAAGASRVSRGGSWFHASFFSRATYRNDFVPIVRSSITGFRCVK